MARKKPDTRPVERRVLDAVRSLVREIRLASTSQRGRQISAAQTFVLQTLLKAPGVRINDLAEQTATDQSSVSVVVQKLVDAGLVTKERSSADGRAFEVRLTTAGRAVAKRTPLAPQRRLVDGLQHMAPARQQALANLLEEWLEALGMLDKAPPMMLEDGKRPKRARR
jgi:MarR family transcriptional regulator, organic hydroperoxide resistance regulator